MISSPKAGMMMRMATRMVKRVDMGLPTSRGMGMMLGQCRIMSHRKVVGMGMGMGMGMVRFMNTVPDRVLLIDMSGTSLGVHSVVDARQMATAKGLILHPVSPKANPPVCKLMPPQFLQQKRV